MVFVVPRWQCSHGNNPSVDRKRPREWGDRHEEKQGRERGVTPRSTRVSLVEAWQLGGRGK